MANVVEDFRIGETQILICDDYCKEKTKEEVQEIVQEITSRMIGHVRKKSF